MPDEFDPRFRPTTAAVASYIKNRTVDANNHYVGDFNSTTTVTDTEVNELIDQAGDMVLAALRWDPTAPAPTIPDSNIPAARALIALLTACFVELTKFSEQVARQVSPFPQLKELFDGMLAQKQADLGIQPPSTGGGSSGLSLWDLIASQYGLAFFNFPEDQMVNWQTAF
jgi:hypothetical protein